MALNSKFDFKFCAGSLAKAEMIDLREAMPSIPHVLVKLHTNPENNKLSMLQNLDFQDKFLYFYLLCTMYLNYR